MLCEIEGERLGAKGEKLGRSGERLGAKGEKLGAAGLLSLQGLWKTSSYVTKGEKLGRIIEFRYER
jgi:hypothetical protein